MNYLNMSSQVLKNLSQQDISKHLSDDHRVKLKIWVGKERNTHYPNNCAKTLDRNPVKIVILRFGNTGKKLEIFSSLIIICFLFEREGRFILGQMCDDLCNITMVQIDKIGKYNNDDPCCHKIVIVYYYQITFLFTTILFLKPSYLSPKHVCIRISRKNWKKF